MTPLRSPAALDVGAEQPNMSRSPRLAQEQVGVHDQPVGDQGVPSGLVECGPVAVQLAADGAPSSRTCPSPLRLAQEQVGVHGQPVGDQGVSAGC